MLGCIRFALDHFASSAGNPITGFTQQEGHVGPIKHTSCTSACTPSTGFTEQEGCMGPIEQASGISGKHPFHVQILSYQCHLQTVSDLSITHKLAKSLMPSKAPSVPPASSVPGPSGGRYVPGPVSSYLVQSFPPSDIFSMIHVQIVRRRS